MIITLNINFNFSIQSADVCCIKATPFSLTIEKMFVIGHLVIGIFGQRKSEPFKTRYETIDPVFQQNSKGSKFYLDTLGSFRKKGSKSICKQAGFESLHHLKNNLNINKVMVGI